MASPLADADFGVMMAWNQEEAQMADLIIASGRGAGPHYVDIENPADVWTWLEPPSAAMLAGIPYKRLGALGNTRVLSPYLYTVELDVAEENLPAIFEWYEREHLPMLTACPGCIGGTRFQRLDDGSPNLLAAYRFERPEVNQTPEWEKARSTEWTLRVRPFFRASRRYMRRLEV
jgi:hypothetical protein